MRRTAVREQVRLATVPLEAVEMIGTVRDLVSRNLRRFVDRGIIRLERRKVIVLDMAELEAQVSGAKRASTG